MKLSRLMIKSHEQAPTRKQVTLIRQFIHYLLINFQGVKRVCWVQLGALVHQASKKKSKRVLGYEYTNALSCLQDIGQKKYEQDLVYFQRWHWVFVFHCLLSKSFSLFIQIWKWVVSPSLPLSWACSRQIKEMHCLLSCSWLLWEG